MSQENKKLTKEGLIAPSRILFFSIIIGTWFYIFLLPSLFLSPIVTRGEAREAQVVQAMERNQQFILPLRNETTVPSKPPLFHWISYVTGKVTGELSPGTIRHPSLICAALLLGTLFYFTASYMGLHISILTCVILISTIEFLRYSTQARVDMVFTCFFCLSVFSLYSFLKSKNAVSFLLCVMTIGLATLAKGPFGFILSMAVICLYLLFQKELFNVKTISALFFISLFSLAFAGAWYYLAYLEQGNAFLETQFFKENLARVVKSDTQELGHNKPIYYTFIYLIQAILPWVIFLPRVILCVRDAQLREYLKKETFLWLHVAWIIVFIVAIGGSVSKRSVYYLPIIPAISLLFAYTLNHSQRVKLSALIPVFEKYCLYVVATILMVVTLFASLSYIVRLFDLDVLAFSTLGEKIPKEIFQQLLTVPTLTILCILSFFAVLIVNIYSRERFDSFIKAFAGFVFIIFLSVQYYFAPVVFEFENPQWFAKEVTQAIGKDNLFQIGDEYYAPVYYLERPAPIIDIEQVNSQKVVYGLISKKDLIEGKAKLPHHAIILESAARLANRKDVLLLIKFTY